MSQLKSRMRKGPTSRTGLSNRRRFSAPARLWALIVVGLLAPAPIQAVAETASIASATPYDDQKAYPTPGSKVRFVEEDDQGVLRGAIFANAWYINPGTQPKFYPSSTGWVKEGPTLILANTDATSGKIEANPPWHEKAPIPGAMWFFMNQFATAQSGGLAVMCLPQTNNDYVPATAQGDTTDAEVFAYRVGTVINIVNGGLECNRAAKWHGGPPQRVCYYNAFAAYFNDTLGVGATRIPAATNVWTQSVSDTSPTNLQSATCYNQKSYYGW